MNGVSCVLDELPPGVEVQTGLENDVEILSHGATLFRFDPETSAWQKRGIGAIHITQNKNTKVCVSSFNPVDPNILFSGSALLCTIHLLNGCVLIITLQRI